MRLHYDYLISNLWRPVPTRLHNPVPGAGDLLLNLTLRYDYMLSDRKLKRIGDDPDQVLTTNRERVSRKLGDLFGLEVSTKYQATDTTSFSATYTYAFKSKSEFYGIESLSNPFING